MSDEQKPTSRGSIRRVGERDRKARLDAGGPLFPPVPPPGMPPPTLPEALPTPDEPNDNDANTAGAAEVVSERASDAVDEVMGVAATIDEDAAALLDELEADYDVESETDADQDTDEDEADEAEFHDDIERFQRPAPAPYPMPVRDRFPPLPDEQIEQPRLKMPRVQPPPPPPKKGGGWKYNLLAFVFVLASCGLFAYFAFLWQNPYSALNPFPPFTPPPIVVSETFEPTLTFTPSSTPTPIPTDTPQPTNTPLPTDTPVPEASVEAQAAETTEEVGGFSLQGGRAIFITNPDGRGGCRWSSIAGTVSDASGQALNEYQIRILGDGVDETVISGTASGYGPGGFELQLGSTATDAEFAVQLLDPNGSPVSDVMTVTTSSRCDWNISVLRFVRNG